MSWEGYGIQVCKNGCLTYFDPYFQRSKCPNCNADIIKSVIIDTTNGYDGYYANEEKQMKELSEKIKLSPKEHINIQLKILYKRKRNAIKDHNKYMDNLNSEIQKMKRYKEQL